MARVGGRSPWVAWPVGVLCAAVIAALVWLAAPGVPGAISFTGDLLRGAGERESNARTTADDAPPEPATDCRSLYPDGLWSELTWTPDVLLDQNTSAPVTTTTLPQALSPEVRFTCTWTAGPRTISTTLARVPGDGAAIASAALTSEGFSCRQREGAGVHCERESGQVREIHDLRGELWLSSTLTGWDPDDYAEQTASRALAG